MANNSKRPGNLTNLDPHIAAELIRIEQQDKTNNPDVQQNGELVKNLATTTQSISTLMNSLGIAVMGLQNGMDEHSKQAMQTLTESNAHLKNASEALGASDQSGNFNNVVQALDKVSHEIQLKLKDVEDAAKTKADIKPQVNVQAPKVDVKAAPVNLKPLEKLMNDKLPAIAQQLADAIPEVPETDLTQVEKLLKSIQSATEATANRKIPIPQFPTNMKVTNPDGSLVGGSSGGGTQYTDGSTAVAHPIGTQQVYVNGSNIETAVSSANPLPVSASVTPVSDNTPASQNITARDIASATATGANSQSIITGAPTAGSAATFTIASRETILVMVSGTWTGTLMSEGSFDGGTTWVSKAIKQIGTAYTSNGFTANFAGAVNVAGLTNYRIRSTATWTGTATTLITLSTNAHSVYTANNTKLEDGTIQSITNTIKPASTAPVPTDTALVVSVSPNSIATTLNSELPDVTGTFTNATQTTAIQATGLNGYDNVFVSISGTYTTATATFQGSDDGGATWKNIAVAARTDTQTIESGYTNLSSIGRGWNINIQGFDAFQVLSSAVATGTVNVRISPESAPTNAGATVGVASLGDGTNNVNVLKSDGTAAGQNAELVAGSYMEKTLSLGPTPTAGQFLMPSTDLSGYKFFSLQVAGGTWTGTYVIEGSNDNVNWSTHQAEAFINNAGSINSFTVNGWWKAGVFARYMRIRCSVTGTGTTTGIIEFWTVPPSDPYQPSSQIGSNSATGSAVPANAFYIGGINNTGNLVGIASGMGDAASGNNMLSSLGFVYNGTTNDRARSANAASNTTGTGLLGVGNLVFDGTNWQAVRSALSDGASTGIQGIAPSNYNGASYDRNRNNTTGAVIAAGTTSTQTGITLTTYNANKLVLVINISAGAGTLTVAINGTTASAYSYNILTSTALTGVAANELRVFPGATPATNLVANDVVPRNLSITATVVGTITYGIDYILAV